jgi:hypothetical protein
MALFDIMISTYAAAAATELLSSTQHCVIPAGQRACINGAVLSQSSPTKPLRKKMKCKSSNYAGLESCCLCITYSVGSLSLHLD